MEKENTKGEAIMPSSAANEDSPAPVGPEAAAAPAVSEYPADLPAAYERLLTEKEGLYDRLLRKQAELENYRKRVQREKDEHIQHANLELVRALLPVLDGFERALQHRDSNAADQFYQGMELIYRHLQDTLKRAGLAPIEAQGKLFDPHVHQAVEAVEVSGCRDQEIVEELQRGYTFKHRLLRPAVVKVAVARRADAPGDEKTEKS
jgi:molecular chaperone GrpE